MVRNCGISRAGGRSHYHCERSFENEPMKLGRLKTRPFCPSCDKPLNGWGAPHGEKPIKGDLTVCVYCGEILEFTRKMSLKVAEAKTIENLDAHEILEVLQIVTEIQKRITRH